MSRFTAAGVPISVLSSPTSFLYGAQASEGIAYVVNADSAVEFVQISDATGTPGHPVPINPGEWILLPYGAYNTIKTINGLTVYAQPGFLNKKQSLFLNSGEDIFYEEASDIFTHFTTPATAGRKHLINMTVGALKGFSLWDRLNYLYVPAQETEQAARINWDDPGVDTLVNSVGAPTFTVDRGFNTTGATGQVGFNRTKNTGTERAFIAGFAWNLNTELPSITSALSSWASGASLGIRSNGNLDYQWYSTNAPNQSNGGNINVFMSANRRPSTKKSDIVGFVNGELFLTSLNQQLQGVENDITNPRIGTSSGTANFLVPVAGHFKWESNLDHRYLYQVFQAYLSIIGAI